MKKNIVKRILAIALIAVMIIELMPTGITSVSASNNNLQIVASKTTLNIYEEQLLTYESEEMPARNLTDTPITILSDGGDYWLSDCPWFGRIEQSDGSLTRFVAILEDGGLMIQNQWTQDGASSAGYESFRRAN